MANSNSKAIFVACLIFASFALANSNAFCTLDVIIRMETCSKVANWLFNGGYDNHMTREQCCNALYGNDSEKAADCLCIIINASEPGKSNEQVDSAIATIFRLCDIQEPEPGTYRCVVWSYDCIFIHFIYRFFFDQGLIYSFLMIRVA